MSDARRSMTSKSNETTVVARDKKIQKNNCEECKAHDEHIKILKNALTEVLDQNEALRARVAELEALISQSEDEVDEKNQLLAKLRATLRELEEQSEKRQGIYEELEKAGGGSNNI